MQSIVKKLCDKAKPKNSSFRVTRPTVFLESVRFFFFRFLLLFKSAMTEARFSSPNSPTETSKRAHRHLHWKRACLIACLIKLTQCVFLLMMSDDVGDLCDHPGGSRMAVNSRILRADQSFLLQDVLALVSWEDYVNRLASVQTGSDA